jgi:hypothetical protein
MATKPRARLSHKMGVRVATGYPCQSLRRLSRITSPDYTKYSSMLAVGKPWDGAAHAMERDHVNPAIIELITLASKCSNLRALVKQNTEMRKGTLHQSQQVADAHPYGESRVAWLGSRK